MKRLTAKGMLNVTKRIEWFDYLKGIAITLVVFRHVMQSNITDCSTSFLGNIIFAVQMPVFMLVAGFFAVTKESYYQNGRALVSYIRKRFFHYMLPFFSWFIIVTVFIRGEYERNLMYALSTLAFNIDVGLWFLYVVFVLSTFLCASKFICYKSFTSIRLRPVASVVLTGIFLFPLLAIGALKGIRFLGINLIVYYYIFFALGNLAYEYKQLIGNCFARRNRRVLVFVVSAIVFFYICGSTNIELAQDSFVNIIIRILAACSGSAALVICAYWLNSKNNWIKKAFCIIGKYTLEIYVVHVQYIGILPKGTHYLLSVDGQGVLLLALTITVVLTAGTIWLIKSVSLLDSMFFGNLEKMNYQLK